MKLIYSLLLLASANIAAAQHVNCTTKEFTISGAVEAAVTINLKALDTFKTVDIPDVMISNHKGEKKSTVTGMKGILLKDILQQIVFLKDSPKALSEFYFLFTACDGYKVVYSWNEIYNTETGNHVFIVTEKAGATAGSMKESILAVSAADFATGRRYMKGLASIMVSRVQ